MADYRVVQLYKHLKVVRMTDRDCLTGRDLYELLNKGLFKGSLDVASSSFVYDYAVFDDDKQDFIVPVGKYSFIGKFHNGLATLYRGLLPQIIPSKQVTIVKVGNSKQFYPLPKISE